MQTGISPWLQFLGLWVWMGMKRLAFLGLQLAESKLRDFSAYWIMWAKSLHTYILFLYIDIFHWCCFFEKPNIPCKWKLCSLRTEALRVVLERIPGTWMVISFPGQSVAQFSSSVISDSLWPHGLQHSRLPCLPPTSWACSNSYLSSQWCHPTFSSSVVPFSSRLQSLPVSGSFPMSQFFASDGRSIRVSASASVLPMNIQNWFHLGLTGQSITLTAM